jgi:hypothetical protein
MSHHIHKALYSRTIHNSSSILSLSFSLSLSLSLSLSPLFSFSLLSAAHIVHGIGVWMTTNCVVPSTPLLIDRESIASLSSVSCVHALETAEIEQHKAEMYCTKQHSTVQRTTDSAGQGRTGKTGQSEAGQARQKEQGGIGQGRARQTSSSPRPATALRKTCSSCSRSLTCWWSSV